MFTYLKRKFYFSKLLYIYLSHYYYVFPTLFDLHIFKNIFFCAYTSSVPTTLCKHSWLYSLVELIFYLFMCSKTCFLFRFSVIYVHASSLQPKYENTFYRITWKKLWRGVQWPQLVLFFPCTMKNNIFYWNNNSLKYVKPRGISLKMTMTRVWVGHC